MYVHMQDLIVMYLVTMTINVMLVLLVAVWQYCYFQEKLDQANTATRRLRVKVSHQADEIKKLQIFNPPAEEIPPPSFDLPMPAFEQQAVAEQSPPMAQEPDQPQASPYAMYLNANQELWKLKVNGEDGSDYGEYLRGVMDECYAKLDATERENVERESADAWKHV